MSKAAKPPPTIYRTVAIENGRYGVEVTPPGAGTTTVHGFMTQADADAWVNSQRKSAPDRTERAKSVLDQGTRDD